MEKKWVRFASLSMAVAVTMGALGAHALKELLSQDALQGFETAVRYQIIHSLGILILGLHPGEYARKNMIFNIMASGMCLFSGSIYLLSTRSLWGMDEALRFLGPITPVGGLLLISGWILLAIGFKTK